jgi:hypothetical protein
VCPFGGHNWSIVLVSRYIYISSQIQRVVADRTVFSIRYIAVWLFGYNQRNSRAANDFSAPAIAGYSDVK